MRFVISERDEYTPSMQAIKDNYLCQMARVGDPRIDAPAAFDRAIAAHDQALREQIEQEVRADMFRGVRAWVERFSPGDRWDQQDAHDLESALLGIVEANPDRSHNRGGGRVMNQYTKMRILRYEIHIDDTAQRVPAGKVVLVQAHRRGFVNRLEVWIQVAEGETQTQTLRVFSTGQKIPAGWRPLGSCVAGHFVWHVYGAE